MPPGIVLRLDPHAVFRIIRLGIKIVLRRLRSFPSPGKDRELDLFSSFLRFFLLPALIPLFLRGPGALFLRESLDSERGGSAVLRRIFLLSALPPSLKPRKDSRIPFSSDSSPLLFSSGGRFSGFVFSPCKRSISVNSRSAAGAGVVLLPASEAEESLRIPSSASLTFPAEKPISRASRGRPEA